MSRRLVVLTPDFPPALGGIQRLVFEIASRLAPTWDVTVVAPRTDGAEEFDRAQSFRTVRTRTRWSKGGRAGILAEMTLAARRARPDVALAAHLATAPVAYAVAAPTAVMLYGAELWTSWARRIARVTRPRVRSWIAISRFTAAEAVAIGVPEARLVLAAPGANVPPLPADWVERLAARGLADAATGAVRPYFLSLGRLAEPHKGHDVFLRALPPLVAREPSLRYVVAGEGAIAEHLRAIAASAGSANAVVFAGAIGDPEKAALLHGCRALVMLSREAVAAGQFEGFGIVYLEAALAGRPSLAGRSGGIPDAVLDGETGLLVDPRDPVAIVEGALRLLEDLRYADELGSRARARAEAEFTWPAAVARVERELESMLG